MTPEPLFRMSTDDDGTLQVAIRGPYDNRWSAVLVDGKVLDLVADPDNKQAALQLIADHVQCILQTAHRRHTTGLPQVGDTNDDRTARVTAVDYETGTVTWETI